MLAARESFVRKATSDNAEEVMTVGVGFEQFLVLFGGEGEVAVDFAAVEAEVKSPPRCIVGCGSEELRFQRLPVQHFCVNRDCAHDSKIVGTMILRGRHAASIAIDLTGSRFHGSSSAIRLIG